MTHIPAGHWRGPGRADRFEVSGVGIHQVS